MAITPQKTREARILLETRGVSKPKAVDVRREALRLEQEQAFQKSQAKVNAAKQKAATPKIVARSFTGLPLPQIGGTGQLSAPSSNRVLTQSAYSASPNAFTEVGPVMNRNLSGGAPTPLGSSTTTIQAPRNLSTFTPDAFTMQLEQILRNQLAPQQAALSRAGQLLANERTLLPTAVSEIPGFQGLSLGQARRLMDVESSGLGALSSGLAGLGEQRQRQFERLTGLAAGDFAQRREIAETQRKEQRQERLSKEQDLSDRRQRAIQEYLSFKQKIIAEGGTPDAKAGDELIRRIQQSDSPEGEISNYLSTAAPFVRKLFAPKPTGGGSTDKASKVLKQAVDLANSMVNSGIWTPEEGKAYVQKYMGEVETPEVTAQDILNEPDSFIKEAKDSGEKDIDIINNLIKIGMAPKEAYKKVTGKSYIEPSERDSKLSPIGKKIVNLFNPPKPPSLPYTGLSFEQGPL